MTLHDVPSRVAYVALWILASLLLPGVVGCTPVPPLTSINPRLGSDHAPRQRDETTQSSSTTINVHPVIAIPLMEAGVDSRDDELPDGWQAAPRPRPIPETYSVPAPPEAGGPSTDPPPIEAPSFDQDPNNPPPASDAAAQDSTDEPPALKAEPTLAQPQDEPEPPQGRLDEDQFWTPKRPDPEPEPAAKEPADKPAAEPAQDGGISGKTVAATGGGILASVLLVLGSINQGQFSKLAWAWLSDHAPERLRMLAARFKSRRTDASGDDNDTARPS